MRCPNTRLDTINHHRPGLRAVADLVLQPRSPMAWLQRCQRDFWKPAVRDDDDDDDDDADWVFVRSRLTRERSRMAASWGLLEFRVCGW